MCELHKLKDIMGRKNKNEDEILRNGTVFFFFVMRFRVKFWRHKKVSQFYFTVLLCDTLYKAHCSVNADDLKSR
jgi:hypothetical protein